MKILAIDTSLSSPGAAIIELRNNKPTIKALGHVKTKSTQPAHLRGQLVYAWLLNFLDKNGSTFDAIIREDFTGKTSATNAPVFSAWAACDRALAEYGLRFDKWQEPRKKPSYGISPSKVKKLVVGKGTAEKQEVADAVREITGYKGTFETDDESDAAAIGLSYLIHKGAMTI